MRKHIKKIYPIILAIAMPAAAIANNSTDLYPFYFGGSLGYGSTNWGGLVDDDSANYSYVAQAVPVAAQNTGIVYGGFVGYNVMRNFAVEARYNRFPTSTIAFSPQSAYGGLNPPLLSFTSSTYTVSIVGKFIVPIKTSPFSAFAEVGGLYTHRGDTLANTGPNYPVLSTPQTVDGVAYSFGGEFGAGLTYDMTERLFTTLEASYGTGNGAAVEYPAKNYIPFTYALQLEMGYRFAL